MIHDKPDLTAWLTKASSAIYLACEASVADDISDGMKKAAAEITRLTERVKELEGMLSPESDHPTRNVGLLYQQARAETAERRVAELEVENETLQDQTENGVIIANWFDLGRELDVPEGGSVFDTVMALKRERDHFRNLYRKTDTECADAERERDQARAALKPFAAVAADYIKRGLDDDDDILAGRTKWRTDEGHPPNVRFADFRAARAIIEKE